MSERKLKNLIEYGLYLAFSGLVRALPRRAAFAFGRALGGVARRLLGKRRRLTADNLRRALPELSESQHQQLLRQTFQHLGVSVIEMLRLASLQQDTPFEAEVVIEGEEHLREAFALGRGVLMLSGHVGFWEIGSFLLPRHGFSVDFVARKMKNPYLDQKLLEIRSRHGCRFIDRHRGARKIVKTLGENRGIGILLDQHTSPKEAVQVNFFGRPCWATPIITQLAMKRQVPVVPAFCTRTADDNYRFRFDRPLLLEGDADASADVQRNTQRLTDLIEAAVRRNPAQWFWMHRRWRD